MPKIVMTRSKTSPCGERAAETARLQTATRTKKSARVAVVVDRRVGRCWGSATLPADSVSKVLGQLSILLVYARTVLKTQYKTQFFKDTTHSQLYYTQKQLSSIVLRGDIQRML